MVERGVWCVECGVWRESSEIRETNHQRDKFNTHTQEKNCITHNRNISAESVWYGAKSVVKRPPRSVVTFGECSCVDVHAEFVEVDAEE